MRKLLAAGGAAGGGGSWWAGEKAIVEGLEKRMRAREPG